MSYYCGVDIGASALKLVIIDEAKKTVALAMRRSGIDYARSAERVLEEALAQAAITRDQIRSSVSTGYGRNNVPWVQSSVTEIACHGQGAFHHFPRPITVVDIGAQDNKIIHLDGQGRRLDFKMNRKCAAGTGSFLEEIALRLDLPVASLNELAEHSQARDAAGKLLYRVRRDRDPGKDPRRCAGRRHRQRSFPGRRETHHGNGNNPGGPRDDRGRDSPQSPAGSTGPGDFPDPGLRASRSPVYRRPRREPYP